jgi:hypothetical protein
VHIIEDSSKTCGIYAKEADVFPFPMKNVDEGIMVDGMCILKSLPSEQPQPYPFVQGSRGVLDNVVYKVESNYTRNHPNIVKQWKEWARDVAPQSDSVEEYVRDHPLNVPLGDILFSGAPVDTTPVRPLEESTFHELKRMRTTDCVQWSRWGFRREDHSTENFARVERCYINGELVD